MVIYSRSAGEFADLTAELKAWAKDNNFRFRSAYSILKQEDTSPVQRRWLLDFIRRWEVRV